MAIVNDNNLNNIILSALEDLYKYAKSVINVHNMSSSSLIYLMSKLIQVAEQYKSFTGYQKKMLVLDTINKVINENVDDEIEKEDLLLLVTGILPTVVDTIVSAINGELNFSKLVSTNCLCSIGKCFTNKCNKNRNKNNVQKEHTKSTTPASNDVVDTTNKDITPLPIIKISTKISTHDDVITNV